MRVSLAGGGTDVASYASRGGGLVIAAAINRYVVQTVYPRHFMGELAALGPDGRVSTTVEDTTTDFISATLRKAGRASDLQISTLSDAPAGTGLGGSGAFTESFRATTGCCV